MTKTNLQELQDEISETGLEIEDTLDLTPERTAYIEHINIPFEERSKSWATVKKLLEESHLSNYHKVVKAEIPDLLFERDEDKTYWLYNEESGVYDELNFSVVRGIVIKLLIDDGFEKKANESFVKSTLNKYRGAFQNCGYGYDDFDSNPDYFHAQNGWVNINTLEFEPHTPGRMSRRVSSVPYDAEAQCPVYDKFLDEQLAIPKDQVRVIDQFSGLLLTPDISMQKMLVLVGKPGCGKSTLLDCWSDILGDCSAQMGLHEIASDSFRFAGSTLVGKQLCWFDEVEVTRSEMGNALINLVTGQTIKVERKGINGFVYAKNRLKSVLTANTLPRSAEMGIYRRMILIYLNYSFYDSMTADKNIREVLLAESSGILNRMLRGLAELKKHGDFTTIEGHDDLIEEYKASSNTVAEFLEDTFTFDETAPEITSKVLLDAYKEFTNNKYSDSLTPQRFGRMLSAHGLRQFDKINTKKDRNGMKVWTGLRLKSYYKFNSQGYIRVSDAHDPNNGF